jgi:hypothetical protein
MHNSFSHFKDWISQARTALQQHDLCTGTAQIMKQKNLLKFNPKLHQILLCERRKLLQHCKLFLPRPPSLLQQNVKLTLKLLGTKPLRK